MAPDPSSSRTWYRPKYVGTGWRVCMAMDPRAATVAPPPGPVKPPPSPPRGTIPRDPRRGIVPSMTQARPEAGCYDIGFEAPFPLDEEAEVALEDYARVLTRSTR